MPLPLPDVYVRAVVDVGLSIGVIRVRLTVAIGSNEPGSMPVGYTYCSAIELSSDYLDLFAKLVTIIGKPLGICELNHTGATLSTLDGDLVRFGDTEQMCFDDV